MNKYLDESEQNICPICNNEIQINDCHSQITHFPINYEIFPLAEKCVMHKIELTKGQYLFMPKNWFHWIFTEPESLSIHYKINNIKFIDKNNDFYNSLKNNIPFYKKNYIEYNINYKEFINKSLGHTYRAIFSESDDCIPVQKNNIEKFFHSDTLKNIIDFTRKNNCFTYVGNQKINSDNIMNKYCNIDNIINSSYYNDISHEPSIWFSLDKKVNSGLHCDTTPNLIHMIRGKKTIYLFSPSCYQNLYINEYPLLKNI
jgi:hypothetical protein